MSKAPPEQRQKVPIGQLVALAEQDLHQAHRTCEARVKAGDMRRADADFKISMRAAIRTSLRLFARFEDAVRGTIEHELYCARLAAEADALRDHPAVDALLDAVPGAEIADIRKLPEDA